MLKSFFDIKKFKFKQVGELPNNQSVYRRIFKYAGPSLMETVMISLLGVIDVIMVSGLGQLAISATGITSQPKFLIMAPILGLDVGVTVVMARRRGDRDVKAANEYLANAFLLSLLMSFIVSAVGYFFAEPILSSVGAKPEYLDMAVSYFKIIMMGNFFYCVSLTLTAAQRGVGNTKVSFATNISSSIVKVILNFILINGFMWIPSFGIEGAGYATLISNVVAFIISIYSVSASERFIKLRFKEIRFRWQMTLSTLKMSVTPFIEQIFIRIGFLLYTIMITNLSVTDYATHIIVMQILSFTLSIGDGLSIASSTLVGQNLGAKRTDLAVIYSTAIKRIGISISLVVSIFIFGLQEPLIALISSNDLEIIERSKIIMPLLTVIVYLQIMQTITIGTLRGAGDLKFIAFLMLTSVGIFRPILTWVLVYVLNLGLFGAWIGVGLDQFIRSLLSQWRYRKGKWVQIKI